MSKLSLRFATAGLLSALTLGSLAAAPAGAKGTVVTKRGTCTGSTLSKLKLHPDGRVIQVEFEVDSNRVGQRWQVKIVDNTAVVFSGARKTVAPSGSFTVERRIANKAGVDNVVATAKNIKTGERCTAKASV